jgi:hypothetical protein
MKTTPKTRNESQTVTRHVTGNDLAAELKQVEARAKTLREQIMTQKANILPAYEVQSLTARAQRRVQAGEAPEQAIEFVLTEYRSAVRTKLAEVLSGWRGMEWRR